ncbi:hypothetical protein MAR_010494 [Mya arenaria]|uniref:Uncharacterized protein n=1 Tax=Mya arenaria TaxID=6604 RepID=A0ABY7E4P1_MYAAR|nr:hypothetical protein MAR_010494 [Mya arenaria]
MLSCIIPIGSDILPALPLTEEICAPKMQQNDELPPIISPELMLGLTTAAELTSPLYSTPVKRPIAVVGLGHLGGEHGFSRSG